MNTNRSPDPLRSSASGDFGKNWCLDHRRWLMRLCYATAMLTASMVTFGAAGLWPALAIVATWAWVFFREPHTKGMTEAAFAWVVLFLLYQAITPTVYDSREPTSAVACSNNLKQIALALLTYHGQYRTLPPAYLADKEGRPMHSWRVLLLPFLEREDLYAQYRFDEPWDGPSNQKLAAQMPRLFACPSDRQSSPPGNTRTNYLAVVGPTTAWRGRHEQTVPASGTDMPLSLMLLETRSEAVEWLAPHDLDVETALRLLTDESPGDWHVTKGFFFNHHTGRRLALADGVVLSIGPLPRQSAESLLGIEGEGTPFAWSTISRARFRHPNYGNWLRFGAFLFLAFLPLRWALAPWRHDGHASG